MNIKNKVFLIILNLLNGSLVAQVISPERFAKLCEKQKYEEYKLAALITLCPSENSRDA